MLSYEDWYDAHIDELLLLFAETGADREMCFELEAELNTAYWHYCQVLISDTNELHLSTTWAEVLALLDSRPT